MEVGGHPVCQEEEAKGLLAEVKYIPMSLSFHLLWGKLREAIMGSEAEGLYGLLRGVTSHSHHLLSQPPPSQSCFHPSFPIPQKLPQESTGPEVLDPIGPTSMSAPSATSSVPEGDLPVDMQPLRIQLVGAKRVSVPG